jgi:YegS/Rv2252/BmrU family lipid kinase
MSQNSQPRAEAGQRVFVILNPVAGNSDVDVVKQTLERAFTQAGRAYRIHQTSGDDDFAALIAKAQDDGYTIIAAAGGDGTVFQVGNELIGSRLTLGIIPVGTANLLARDLGIPLELEDACALLADAAQTRTIDAMQVAGKVFFTRLSLGMYSRITEKTPASAKRIFRRLAYIWYAIPELFGIRTWRFRVTVDDQVYHLRASFIFIANVGEAGVQGLTWGSHIHSGDGVIDVCVMRGRTFWHYLQFVGYFLLNRHRDFGRVNYFQARNQIVISASRRVPTRGDGEDLQVTPLELKVLPAAVKVIAPAQTENV